MTVGQPWAGSEHCQPAHHWWPSMAGQEKHIQYSRGYTNQHNACHNTKPPFMCEYSAHKSLSTTTLFESRCHGYVHSNPNLTLSLTLYGMMLECCCAFPALPPAPPPTPRAGRRFSKAGEVLSRPDCGPEELRTADYRRGRNVHEEDMALHKGVAQS